MIEKVDMKIDFCKLTGQKIASETINNEECKILNISEDMEMTDICFHAKNKRCPYELISNLEQLYSIENKNISVKIIYLDAFDREIQSDFLEQCDVISIPADATKVAFCFADKYDQYHTCFFH